MFFFFFLTKTLSVCPPSRLTSRLDRAASTSSISGSLEWCSVSSDKVSLQMWYWGNRTGLTSLQQFIITRTWLKNHQHHEKVSIKDSWHDLGRGAPADTSQTEVWRPAASPVCRWGHQNLNHTPTACKTPSEPIKRRFNLGKNWSIWSRRTTFPD